MFLLRDNQIFDKVIDITDLMTIARERLTDAESLYHANRFDGAVYLCGYAIELALKHKICQTLNWAGFPSTSREFENYKSLKTHNLAVLLSFTGIEALVKSTYLTEWSAVSNWNPEERYNISGQVSQSDALLMLNSANTLLGIL
jgi:hypothetical protein